ncbi:MAG: polyprenyl synthetase family protein [Myxococcota bacterium]|nr:polyprenyl synthetase family protein [Myxococcota bacterium]
MAANSSGSGIGFGAPASPALAEAMVRVLERIAEPLALVERALHEQLTSEIPLVSDLGKHILSAGGKRLRPALVLLAAELCGYTGPRRIGIAAAVEMLHTATLLHDDVVDRADLRRGEPSVNAVWGNRRAVLAGDFLYARSSSMVVEDGDVEILEVFAAAIQRIAEGELLQLEQSFEIDITERRYFEIIEGKSAVLLSGACLSGAILGGVTRAERRQVSAYGRELGLAFQLKDDALDYDTSASLLGKRRYADLAEGKVTLPLILTLKRCSVAERELIATTLKTAGQREGQTGGALTGLAEDDPQAEAVAELVDRHRGVVDTLRRADESVGRAIESLDAFPDSSAKQALVAAAAFSVSRDR